MTGGNCIWPRVYSLGFRSGIPRLNDAMSIARLELILILSVNELCFMGAVVPVPLPWQFVGAQEQAKLSESHWKKCWSPPLAILFKQLKEENELPCYNHDPTQAYELVGPIPEFLQCCQDLLHFPWFGFQRDSLSQNLLNSFDSPKCTCVSAGGTCLESLNGLPTILYMQTTNSEAAMPSDSPWR